MIVAPLAAPAGVFQLNCAPGDDKAASSSVSPSQSERSPVITGAGGVGSTCTTTCTCGPVQPPTCCATSTVSLVKSGPLINCGPVPITEVSDGHAYHVMVPG